MGKNILISEHLFDLLIAYHIQKEKAYEDEIELEISEKLHKMYLHDFYTRSKTAPTEEERKEAMDFYLNKKAILDNHFSNKESGTQPT